jgi:hypothetical protein
MKKKNSSKFISVTQQWSVDLLYRLKAPRCEIVQSGDQYVMKPIKDEFVDFKIWDNTIYSIIVQMCGGMSFIYTNAKDINSFMSKAQEHIKKNGYTHFDDGHHSDCKKVQESIQRLIKAGYLVKIQTGGNRIFIPTARFLNGTEYTVVTGFASGSIDLQQGIWKDENHKATAYRQQQGDKDASFRKSVKSEQRMIKKRKDQEEKENQRNKITYLEGECARLRRINSGQDVESIDFDNEWNEPEVNSDGFLEPPF